MKEINGFIFEQTAEEAMSDKIWRDLYDIVMEHAGDNPEKASKWFAESFGAADGFTEWLMEFHPIRFEMWATGYYDE